MCPLPGCCGNAEGVKEFVRPAGVRHLPHGDELRFGGGDAGLRDAVHSPPATVALSQRPLWFIPRRLGKQMALVRTLTDRDQDQSGLPLPPGLRELYDGDLRFRNSPAERPFVIANFVSTLDGVVSYEIKGQAGGSTVSGSDTADGFIMGLLRASADAVIVGARTVHDASPEALWTPEYTYPDAKLLFREYRVNVLHKPEYPLLVVVSGSGRLELERAIFRTPGMRTAVITTSAGSDALVRAGATKLPSVQIHALDAKCGTMAPMAMLRLLYAELGVRRLLHEGGPTLFGQFLGRKL
jgi:riboflavin biosynthesis pyrimidine reductase